MGRHAAVRTGRSTGGAALRWLAMLLAVVAVASVAVAVWNLHDPQRSSGTARPSSGHAGSAGTCPTRLTVVSASSFAPALRQIAAPLAAGPHCVAVTTTVADGQNGAAIVAASNADAWIPDDISWPQLPNAARLAPGPGTVIATSPMYFVTRRSTPLPPTARSWLGLAQQLAQQRTWHLALRDPAATGDAMVAAGGLAGAVFAADGPLVSALDQMRAWQAGTTLGDVSAGLPAKDDQVGIVPEYALVASGHTADYAVVAPTDGTELLRFSWFRSSSAAANPTRSAALATLYRALTAPSAGASLAAAGLRGASWPAPVPTAASESGLPAVTAAPIAAIVEHLMFHVLSTWHPAERRANMLVVLDVSGSMAEPAPGTTTAKIDLLRQGLHQVVALLPDTSQVGLWQFGAQLAPPKDWQPLVESGPLSAPQRAAIDSAGARLTAHPTGTGLYDTILAAYKDVQAHYQHGIPNEVVVFTDGVNQDDPVSVTLDQLRAGLAAADPVKRVQLSVFGLGAGVPVTPLTTALEPVGGQVDQLTGPDGVLGAFVHAVSGALSGSVG